MSKRKIFRDRDEIIYARFMAGKRQKAIGLDYELTESGVKQAVARVRRRKNEEAKKGVT